MHEEEGSLNELVIIEFSHKCSDDVKNWIVNKLRLPKEKMELNYLSRLVLIQKMRYNWHKNIFLNYVDMFPKHF